MNGDQPAAESAADDDGLRLSPAAEALSEFLDRVESGEVVDFDAFCREHVDCESELRRLHGRVMAATDILDASGADSVSGTSEPPPTRIGPYRIDSIRGTGGMGTVFVARDAVGERVAVKVIRSGLASRRARERFALEREVLRSLDHPNVARVRDAGVDDRGDPYIAMEYVDGPPMHRFASPEATPLQVRLSLFLGACAGVAHAHGCGILHRDIKPSNVLVALEGDEAPVPKVIDFGLARALDESVSRSFRTTDGVVLGTPEYMSPEQAAAGSRPQDERTDIYALGVLLYEMVTGRHPYGAEAGTLDAIELIRRIVQVPPNRAGDQLLATAAERRATGAILDEVIERCLRKDPRERFESVDLLMEPVAEARRLLEGIR